MSTTARAQRLAVEAAERRVLDDLRSHFEPPSSAARRVAVAAGATLLFLLVFAARLAIRDPGALIANFYVVPIALVAIEVGARAGAGAAGLALGLVLAWSAFDAVHGGRPRLRLAGRGDARHRRGRGSLLERLRRDIAERERAQKRLTLYADQLERANEHFAQTVKRLAWPAGQPSDTPPSCRLRRRRRACSGRRGRRAAPRPGWSRVRAPRR